MRIDAVSVTVLVMVVTALLLLVLLALVFVFLARFTRNLKRGITYEAVPLLTPAEQSFFSVLKQAITPNYAIFCKVRLADLICPANRLTRSGWQSAFNRTACKHVDFVLFDPHNFRVVAAIELDDRTHKRFDRGLRDAFVDAALADANIPVLRVPAARAYAVAQIREQLENLVSPKPQNR